MKLRQLMFLFMLPFAVSSYADGVDVYQLKMSVKVPRVYDNMQSMGYRRYQTQHIQGLLYIQYGENGEQTFSISNLVNKTHRIQGKNVSYTVKIDDEMFYPRLNCIGNNRTLVFKRSSISFFMVADPSYSIWQVPDQDNSLQIFVSGFGMLSGGRKAKKMSGTVAGQLGCGCTAYGHTSPTRRLGFYGPFLDFIDDVASVSGTWKARLIR